MKIKTIAIVAAMILVLVGGWALMRHQTANTQVAAAETAAEHAEHGEHEGEEAGHEEEAGVTVPGLETLKVMPTSVSSRLALTGEVEADADLTARVGSAVSGRLSALRVSVGDRVQAGQTLATVSSRDVAEVRSALTRAQAEEKAAAAKLQTIKGLAAAGALSSKPLEEAKNEYSAAVAAVRQAENAVSNARSAREAAARELERVKQLAASQAYQARPVEDAKREVALAQAELDTAQAQIKVRQAAYDRSKRLFESGLAAKREVESTEADLGEARATHTEATTHLQIARQVLLREEGISKQDLYSIGEVRQAQATLREAERDVQHETADLERTRGHLQVATSSLEREKKISQGDLLARREVQEAQSALTVARAEVQAARQSLTALKASGGRGGATLPIVAPISGVVTERSATPGQAVEASTDLFTIVNPSRVWVWGNVHEKDLSQINPGQMAEIRVTSYPDRLFAGRVGLVSQALDPKSRTARVKCVVSNPGGLLKPGMFASVNLQVGGSRSGLLVPSDAVLDEAGKKIVFIACMDCEEDVKSGKSCGAFDKMEVELGAVRGGNVEVRKGLDPGSLVVVKGQYQLKTALGSGQLEAGCTDH
ncbi:MAG: efflux RND transporter periplasmic adaptor subunit [Armatimonadota bacterium]